MIKFNTAKPRVKRSSKWPALRKRFLKDNFCRVCGGRSKLEAHHIVTFHDDPSRELDESNLIALCEAHKCCNCHCLIGHLGNYKSHNVDVVIDAARWFNRLQKRPL